MGVKQCFFSINCRNFNGLGVESYFTVRSQFLMAVAWDTGHLIIHDAVEKGKLSSYPHQSFLHIKKKKKRLFVGLCVYIYIFATGLGSLKSLKIYIQSVFLFIFHFIKKKL